MRGCHLLGGRQVAAAKSRQLPPEDIAFMCQSQQNRVCRGGVVNKTQGASSSPLGARETRPNREWVQWVTKTRVTRQCHK